MLDVREADERDEGYIAGAAAHPVPAAARRAPTACARPPVVTICSSGARAGIAASVLAARGVDARPVLDGGVADWQQRGGRTSSSAAAVADGRSQGAWASCGHAQEPVPPGARSGTSRSTAPRRVDPVRRDDQLLPASPAPPARPRGAFRVVVPPGRARRLTQPLDGVAPALHRLEQRRARAPRRASTSVSSTSVSPTESCDPLAVVLDRDDVHALLRDQREQLDAARPAGRRCACARRGSGRRASGRGASPRSAASGRCCRRRGARTTGPSPPTSPASSAATDAAPAPSTSELRALEQQHDRLADLLVGDRRRRRRAARARIGHRQLAGLLDRDPVGDREAVDRPPANGAHAAACTPTMRSPAQLPQRDRDAGREPAAADRDDHRLRRRAAARRARARSSPGPRSRARPRTRARTSRRLASASARACVERLVEARRRRARPRAP